jgi:hypothetical protein
MTQMMISQLGILESNERSKTENERLRNDRRDCRFTLQNEDEWEELLLIMVTEEEKSSCR